MNKRQLNKNVDEVVETFISTFIDSYYSYDWEDMTPTQYASVILKECKRRFLNIAKELEEDIEDEYEE